MNVFQAIFVPPSPNGSGSSAGSASHFKSAAVASLSFSCCLPIGVIALNVLEPLLAIKSLIFSVYERMATSFHSAICVAAPPLFASTESL